jgi:hypothetical protein
MHQSLHYSKPLSMEHNIVDFVKEKRKQRVITTLLEKISQ